MSGVRSVRSITLTVRDLAGVRAFYEHALGLRVHAAADGRVALGAETPLLILEENRAAAPDGPRTAGLFHTALLLPKRADLAAWLEHARTAGVRLDGAADHLVSEAVYLSDPEGNGIEVYVDRPAGAWTWTDGEVQFANAPLDFAGLAASGGPPWAGAPAGTVIGHVHLRVGDLDRAEAFYAGVAGLPVTSRWPQARFFGAGGYHHHLGANTWASAGAGPRTEGAAGLAGVTFAADGLDAVAERAAAAGVTAEPAANGLALRDPWGTRIALAA